MKANTYFETLEEAGRKYEMRKEELNSQKSGIIDTYGYDSDELKAWYAKKEANVFPYSQGAVKAYRAWKYSETEELEMSDYTWEGEETADFIDALRKAGVKSFVYTNQSTAVMENIHGFINAGCRMDGPCTLTKVEDFYGREKKVEVLGIRFLVD